MRSTPILALLVAGCGAPAKSAAPAEPPSTPAAAPSEPPAAPAPAPAPVAVHADPDTPAGADAARDAELAKAVAGVFDAFTNSQARFTRDGHHVVFVSDRADQERMVVYGGSYGGHTVLIGLTRMPDLWRAGVDLVGIANLKTFMATTSGFIHEVFLLEFGDPDRDAAFLDSISPLRDADRIVDPLFVYAGANDPRVPRSESDQIVQALRARKVPVEYMVAGNEGHSLAHRDNQIAFYARVARFLDSHLK